MNCGWYSAPSAASGCVIGDPGATLAPGIVAQADSAIAAHPARAICFIILIGRLGIALSSYLPRRRATLAPPLNSQPASPRRVPGRNLAGMSGGVDGEKPFLAHLPDLAGRKVAQA